MGVFLRSRIAAIGAGFYLLTFLCASLYYLPNAWPSLLLAVMLNAGTIYALLAALSVAPALLRSLRK
jgi:hypothetical protein